MFSCDSCKQCNPLFSFKYSFGKFNPLLFIRIASYIWIHYHLISYLVYFSFVSLLNFFASFKLFFPPHSIYALYYLSCYRTTAKGIFTFESMLITISAPTCSFPCDFLLGLVKNPPAMWETWVQSLTWEDPLQKGTATHSSILAWRIHGLYSPSGRRVSHDWVTFTSLTPTCRTNGP